MGEAEFYHKSVMLHEAVRELQIKESGIYVDATFGGGGHSKEILKSLGVDGRLVAFDQDDDAWRNKPEDGRLVQVHANFRYLRRFLKLHGCAEVDGVLADLGVSSYQFDTGERGFSIRYDGPLDMRMDSRTELTAKEVLQTYSEHDLHKMFEQYGEVRNARQLARHIVGQRDVVSLDSISAFKAMLASVIKGKENRYLAQVFQALRIEVNDEMGALRDLLEQSVECLKAGGRLVVITFHSIEDRLVKQFMKKGYWGEVETDVFGRAVIEQKMKPVYNKPIEPEQEELNINTRARSARLRVAEKL